MIDLGQIGQITKTFRSSSAAVPSLILSAIFGPISIVGSIIADGSTATGLAVTAIASFALPALQIIYFTFMEPDRLQNEEHVENKLLIAQGKMIRGDNQTMIDVSVDQTPVANPALEGKSDV